MSFFFLRPESSIDEIGAARKDWEARGGRISTTRSNSEGIPPPTPSDGLGVSRLDARIETARVRAETRRLDAASATATAAGAGAALPLFPLHSTISPTLKVAALPRSLLAPGSLLAPAPKQNIAALAAAEEAKSQDGEDTETEVKDEDEGQGDEEYSSESSEEEVEPLKVGDVMYLWAPATNDIYTYDLTGNHERVGCLVSRDPLSVAFDVPVGGTHILPGRIACDESAGRSASVSPRPRIERPRDLLRRFATRDNGGESRVDDEGGESGGECDHSEDARRVRALMARQGEILQEALRSASRSRSPSPSLSPSPLPVLILSRHADQ